MGGKLGSKLNILNKNIDFLCSKICKLQIQIWEITINTCDSCKFIISGRGGHRDYSPQVPKKPNYAAVLNTFLQCNSQAIKSFSIRDGRQHITLAFPFMEELVKKFAEPPGSTSLHEGSAKCGRFMSITPALLFDRSPEVIHGFETLVTLVPTTHRYVCNRWFSNTRHRYWLNIWHVSTRHKLPLWNSYQTLCNASNHSLV